jgi:aspartate racemase
MKRIGILGGMSWESSLVYYRIINESIKKSLGSSHSADLLMYSFDFDEIEKLQRQNQWDLLRELMVKEAMNLKLAGAEFIVIATNTMHIVADAIEAETGLQVLHIGKVTGEAIKKEGINKVLLLGTEFTMMGKFYKDILEAMGICIVVPDPSNRAFVHHTIYEELVKGFINPLSRSKFIEIIEDQALQGVEGVILGCTEIPLLINDGDVSIKVFNTTSIHAQAAAHKSIFSEDK